MNVVDFLAIGDITTDAFIRLKEANISCDIDHRNCTISMRFADKIPYEFVEIAKAVGNSPNAAVSAARLGLTSALVSNVGNDQNGKDCIETLRSNGVLADFVSTQKDKVTNYHYVLWYLDERTILVKHEAYDYVLPSSFAAKWVYLSSLAENSLEYHHAIADYISKSPQTKLVFQPGTYQMRLGVEKIASLYKQSEIFFCNVEEAERILNISGRSPRELLTEMQKLGPKIIVITDGPKGAYALHENTAWFMPIYPDPKPPYERTGCGDAFASTFTTAIALGKTIEEALMWAPVNPMSVVQYIGAQRGLLTRSELESLLEKAPSSYKPQPI